MPLYDYRCDGCSTWEIERIYEIGVSFEELEDLIYCPECKSILQRINFYAVPGRVH